MAAILSRPQCVQEDQGKQASTRSADYMFQRDKDNVPETHLKPKSRELSFAHNLLASYINIVTFCTAHDSDTVARALCKYKTDWTTETNHMD